VPFLNDNTLDNGLAAPKAAADRIFINNAEPATYTAASSTNLLGTQTFAAGSVFPGAIAAGSPSGRKITTAPVTAGPVTVTGTASHWSVATSGSTRLEAASSLSASQGVTSGNTFALPAFDIRLANTGG
jgi:hypothetical protein